MFPRSFIRSTVAAVVAAAVLVPAAQADDWARDGINTVDPAIAAAIHDRSNLTATPVTLDPAIQAALLEHSSSSMQPEQAAAGGGFHWSTIGVGTGATLAALLIAFGSLLGVRHSRARVTNA